MLKFDTVAEIVTADAFTVIHDDATSMRGANRLHDAEAEISLISVTNRTTEEVMIELSAVILTNEDSNTV
jgi:hypothetical protein